ncbi:MAG: nucleotide pyrophosphohydrolase [Candidatus Omnitrophica bacterium]|nr:nucleotide pyrophosphohydrolase [Candidatus Omnitrophota bacterium]MBU1996001.1 nucleotide pyrophosphohydrolase [Candidatus Omnitrophota bacterium]MBU4334670.1 nucleotide pyrophosphohydrolase [Candidatus Omnitrophota bacterium]
MSDKNVPIQRIKNKIKKFVKERDWEQYHSPKNLGMSIAIEAAELMEIFQWLTEEQSFQLSKKQKTELEDEIADIAVYILNMCNVLNIDLSEAIAKKMIKNEKKYPAKLVKGKMHKYTHYKEKNSE